MSRLTDGELTDVAVLVEEERVIAQAVGASPVGYDAMVLAAWRGQEAQASELIDGMIRTATAGGPGRMVDVASYSKAVLYNGLGRYEAARAAFEHRDHVGIGMFVVGELAEAASRTGRQELIAAALEWMSERTRESIASLGRSRHRAARHRRADEPGDRRRALHQPPHRRVAPEEGVHEARDQLAQGARRRPAPARGDRARRVS